MRRFGYGINSFHKKASIWVDYAPFWVFWLDDIFNFLCDRIPALPLPPIPLRLFNEGSIEFNDGRKWVTLREWCGDLRGLFHLYVHTPILNYCFGRTDGRVIQVNYNKARKVFYDKDKEFWDDHEAMCEEIKDEQ